MEAPVRGALIDVTEPDAPADGVVPVPEPRGRVDRRTFLNASWKVLGVGLAVEAAWTSYDILNPKASGAFGGVLNAGAASEYKEGTIRYFLDGRFYVTASSGALVALYQKCPHLGCRVPFCESSGRFECPCHGSKYNIRGEYIEGPAPRGMDRFPIKIDGGQVFVDTVAVVEGPPRGVSTVSDTAKGPSCVGETTAPGAAGAGQGQSPAGQVDGSSESPPGVGAP
jgi:cytochrome b6-f complex iron-sulfur subunit